MRHTLISLLLVLLPTVAFAQDTRTLGRSVLDEVRQESYNYETGVILAMAQQGPASLTPTNARFTTLNCNGSTGTSSQVLVGGNPCTWTGSPSITRLLVADGTAAAPSLTFASNPTSGLWLQAANKLGLTTNGSATSGITIDSSGNVGIGTTNPQSTLHVKGGAAIFDNPSGTIRVLQTTSTLGNNDLGIWNKAGGGGDVFVIGDWNTGTKGLFINTNTGNVGIGTTSPSALLTLASTGSLGFDNGSGTSDVLLSRDGAPSILALKHGTNAQTFRVYDASGTAFTAMRGDGFVSNPAAVAVANVGANSCGTTAATIAGGNNAFVITVGATSGSQCRVTFTFAAANEWDCAANDSTTTVAVRTTPVDTTHTDLIGAFTAGDRVTGICFPR